MKNPVLLFWRWLLHRRRESTPQQQTPEQQQSLVSSKITSPLPVASYLAREAHMRARLEPDSDEEDITNQITLRLPVVRSVPPMVGQRRLLLGSGAVNCNEPTVAAPAYWPTYNDDTVRMARPVDVNATLPMSLAEIMR